MGVDSRKGAKGLIRRLRRWSRILAKEMGDERSPAEMGWNGNYGNYWPHGHSMVLSLAKRFGWWISEEKWASKRGTPCPMGLDMATCTRTPAPAGH